MAVALGLGKFYGSSLPRPRFYTDMKFASDRVDPPASVSEPFLYWASEAHWSMGGLSFKRLRLQGRIEGSIEKLRTETLKSDNKKLRIRLNAEKARLDAEKIRNIEEDEFVESESESEHEFEVKMKPEAVKKMARKLVDEFEEVANYPLKSVGHQTRSKRSRSDNDSVKRSCRSDKSFEKSSSPGKSAVKRSKADYSSAKKSHVNFGTARRTSPRKIT